MTTTLMMSLIMLMLTDSHTIANMCLTLAFLQDLADLELVAPPLAGQLCPCDLPDLADLELAFEFRPGLLGILNCNLLVVTGGK